MMTRRQVLRHLRRLPQLRKEAAAKQKQATRLQREADAAASVVESLRGVKLYDRFPLRIVQHGSGYEILSACSDSQRSAYVGQADDKWAVTGYRNDGDDEDGVSLGVFPRGKALAAARRYVIMGARR